MRAENIFHQWKKHRMQVHVPGHFTADVMQRIADVSNDNKIEFPVGTYELSNRLARWFTAGGLVLLGIFRLLYIMTHLLQPHLLMH